MDTKKYQLLGSASSGFSLKPPTVPRLRERNREPLRSVPPSKIDLPPPLMKGERGAVIGPAAIIARANPEDDLDLKTRDTDLGVVKTALLFVDKINKPRNTIMTLPEDYYSDLTHIGLGSTSTVHYSEGLTYTQASSYVWDTYLLLNEREPGSWSIWPQYDTNVIPGNLLTPDLSFQIDLNKGLIVPEPSTPFEELILFKERHRDELIALRHYLEDFAIKLSKEGDPRAVNLERERFDVSLAEYLKKARQSNIKRAVASLTMEIDWAATIRSTIGGGSGGLLATAQGLSLTHTAAAIGGGVLASLSVKSVAGLRSGPSPFRYLARIEKEYGS